MLQRTRGVEGMGKMVEARRSESVGIICKDPVHSKTRVAIVGGGIEGLAVAVALARRGFQVCVFEKDAGFLSRKQGYGLTLQQGGLALRCLGVSDAIAQASSWDQSHFVFDSQGEVVCERERERKRVSERERERERESIDIKEGCRLWFSGDLLGGNERNG